MNPKHDTRTERPKWRAVKETMKWADAPPAELKLAIAAVTSQGGSIMFSTTMDGGALILSIWNGNEKAKEYCTSPGDISALLQWVASTWS